MISQMQNAINQIFENKELSKKLIKLETLDEIFELFKSIDITISKEDFEEGINEILEKSGEKLTDETLSEVSGGTLNKSFKKSLAATLAALSVGSSQIYAAPQTTSKTSKVISAAFLAALGITGATALGAILYHIMSKPGDLAEKDLKDIYYELLTNSSNSEQLEEAFNALSKLNGTNEKFGEEFNKIFLREKKINSGTSLEDAKTLFKNRDFFYALPLQVIEKISPEKIRKEVEKIISIRKAQLENAKLKDSTSETSNQNASSFIKGLPNSLNSCHLNATLQLLRQIPEIREGNVQPEGTDSDTTKKINTLNEVMKAINNKNVADENFKKKEELLKLLYPKTKQIEENGELVEKKCCELPQDAFETLKGLNLPYESLEIGITEPLEFNAEKEITDPVNTATTINNGLPIQNAKHKIFSISLPNNKKIFPETYTSSGQEFELKCIVCFVKLTNYNHYYAYSKDENGVWHKCNDNKMETTTFENMKNDSKNAVIFLYSRVDKT